MDLTFSGTGGKCIAAGADNLSLGVILWVDRVFHSLQIVSGSGTLIKGGFINFTYNF